MIEFLHLSAILLPIFLSPTGQDQFIMVPIPKNLIWSPWVNRGPNLPLDLFLESSSTMTELLQRPSNNLSPLKSECFRYH
ncbi:hypothetical protein AMTRI_Chr05g71980 [Amborella trichopoda]